MLVLWQQHQSTSYADTRYLRVINIYQFIQTQCGMDTVYPCTILTVELQKVKSSGGKMSSRLIKS